MNKLDLYFDRRYFRPLLSKVGKPERSVNHKTPEKQCFGYKDDQVYEIRGGPLR